MKSLSTHISESFQDFESSKFLTTVYRDSSETGDIWDSAIGYIDKETTLSYCVPIDDGPEPWFRLTTGKKFHDSDKRNWSKKYLSIDSIPSKYANHAQELKTFMDSELLLKSLDDDLELKDFMSESLNFSFANNNYHLIDKLVDVCKKSSGFLKKLLDNLENVISNRPVATNLNEEFIFERSWFRAIVTNALLYIAAVQVAKISNKWIRAFLMALIVAKVISSNDLGAKLQKFINLNK